MRKILVVEDDLSLGDGLKINLESFGYLVDIAVTGKDALVKIDNINCDLVILDISLPDVQGYEICKAVKKKGDIPVIFLTARDLESDELLGFDSGGDDYVRKPFSTSVLKKRIAAVLERYGKNETNQIWSDGYLNINFDSLKATLQTKEIYLTAFELKILKFFICNGGSILTRQILLEKLWDNKDFYVDEHALTVSINRLRNKLENGERKYIKTVYGMGYMWMGNSDEK